MTEKEKEAKQKYLMYQELIKKNEVNIKKAHDLLDKAGNTIFDAEKKNAYRSYIDIFSNAIRHDQINSYKVMYEGCSHVWILSNYSATKGRIAKQKEFTCIKCGLKYVNPKYVFPTSVPLLIAQRRVLKNQNVNDADTFEEFVRNSGPIISEYRMFNCDLSCRCVKNIIQDNPDITNEELVKVFVDYYDGNVRIRSNSNVNYRTQK